MKNTGELSALDLKRRAYEIIPGGTSTRGRQAIDGVPMHALNAQGTYITASDGNNYLDMRGALGANLLGYGFLESHSQRLQKAFQEGPLFSLTCTEEVELAEILLSLHPKHDMVRFFKTGADVCSASIRIARAATGKKGIISCGYHGWHDVWATGNIARSRGAEPSLGIPDFIEHEIIEVNYGDIQALQQAAIDLQDVAAIITVPLEWSSLPDREFIQTCRDISFKHHAALIFDEVFCGFRLDMRGGTGFYNIEPDMICLSKAMASGYPISALLGNRDFLQYAAKTLMSSTYATDKISLVAAIETIRLLQDEKLNVLQHNQALGKFLKQQITTRFNEIDYDDNVIFGLDAAPRLIPLSNDKQRSNRFAKLMAANGILSNGIFLLNYSQKKEDILRLVETTVEVIKRLDIRDEI